MIRGVGALLLWVGLTACRPVPAASALRVDPPRPAAPVAATPPLDELGAAALAAGEVGSTGGLRLERVPVAARPAGAPMIELLAPFSGAVISLQEAASSRVRVNVASWPLGETGNGVAVMLDGDRPRVLRQAPVEVRLGDLPSDGRPVGPGLHRLVAAAVDAEGIAVRPPPRGSRGSVAVVDFFVGARGELPPDAPFLIVLSPSVPGDGGVAAGAPLVDCFAVGASLAAGEVRLAIELTGPEGRWAVDLGDDEPRRVHGLGPGDHSLEIVLTSGEGSARRVLDRVRRAFAVGPTADLGGLPPPASGRRGP